MKSFLLILALVGVSSLCFGQEQKAPERRAYLPSGSEATLMGTITLTGERPPEKRIDASADPVCLETSPELTTEYAAGNSGKLANAFVYLKNNVTLESFVFELPTKPVVLERKGCRFSPRVLGVRAGQQLAIYNLDTITHNTHPVPRNNPEWNQSQPPAPAEPIIKTFVRQELFIPFKCNQHPWEKAWLGVMSHPFFAVSDDDGGYRIEGIPAGTYTVVAWHEIFGEKTAEVVLSANESRYLEFNFVSPVSTERRGVESTDLRWTIVD